MRLFFEKTASFLLTLFLLLTLTFVLMKAVPGDPFSDEQFLPKELHEALLKHYQLDEPVHVQYLNYLKTLLKGDLGPSLKYQGRTVNSIIRDGFPISALLGAEALLIAISGGLLLGMLAALKEQRWQDHLVMIITVLCLSFPNFIVAAFLQYSLALKLGIFPIARWGTWMQTVLPAISLALVPMAFIARLTRANMVTVLQQDYIKNAKAKGLPMRQVLFRHALRNTLIPVCAYLGQLLAGILFGSFIIEKIFSIPGLGGWFVNSVSNRDYAVIMGITLFYSILLLLSTFLIDIVYGILDPRIRAAKAPIG